GGTSSTTPVKSTGTLGTSDIVYTLGSVSDTWGRSWTPSEFSDANFRLRLIGQPSSNTIQLDAIQVKVSHSSGGGGSGGGGEVYKQVVHNLTNTLDAIERVVEVLRILFLKR
ncbi:hypothetical protein IIB50_01365, partial [Patescibacteria group bacterium]|nr:hypothetical protein [Patescibacteria group bacterium]